MLIFDDAPADCFLPPANSHIDIFSSNSREFEQYSYLEVFKQRKVISFVSDLIFCLTFIYLVMIDKHMALRCSFFQTKMGWGRTLSLWNHLHRNVIFLDMLCLIKIFCQFTEDFVNSHFIMARTFRPELRVEENPKDWQRKVDGGSKPKLATQIQIWTLLLEKGSL